MTANVISHHFLAGAPINGLSPNGAPTPVTTVTPTFSGVVNSYEGCTNGGLFAFSTLAPLNGVSLIGVLFEGAGTTDFFVDILAKSLPYSNQAIPAHRALDGAVAQFTRQASSVESFAFYFDSPVLVPPGFDVQVTTAGNLTAEARLTLIVGPGFAQPVGYTLVRSN
jgi:hypothetical protein